MDIRKQITVAVDHSPAAGAALRWAVGEAARVGAEVVAVHVIDVRERADLAHVPHLGAARAQACVATQQWVHDAIDGTLVDLQDPDATHDPFSEETPDRPRVSVYTATGGIQDELMSAARSAVALVLGQPDGAAHEQLADQLASRCACPVILVDETGRAVPVREPVLS